MYQQNKKTDAPNKKVKPREPYYSIVTNNAFVKKQELDMREVNFYLQGKLYIGVTARNFSQEQRKIPSYDSKSPLFKEQLDILAAAFPGIIRELSPSDRKKLPSDAEDKFTSFFIRMVENYYNEKPSEIAGVKKSLERFIYLLVKQKDQKGLLLSSLKQIIKQITVCPGGLFMSLMDIEALLMEGLSKGDQITDWLAEMRYGILKTIISEYIHKNREKFDAADERFIRIGVETHVYLRFYQMVEEWGLNIPKGDDILEYRDRYDSEAMHINEDERFNTAEKFFEEYSASNMIDRISTEVSLRLYRGKVLNPEVVPGERDNTFYNHAAKVLELFKYERERDGVNNDDEVEGEDVKLFGLGDALEFDEKGNTKVKESFFGELRSLCRDLLEKRKVIFNVKPMLDNPQNCTSGKIIDLLDNLRTSRNNVLLNRVACELKWELLNVDMLLPIVNFLAQEKNYHEHGFQLFFPNVLRRRNFTDLTIIFVPFLMQYGVGTAEVVFPKMVGGMNVGIMDEKEFSAFSDFVESLAAGEEQAVFAKKVVAYFKWDNAKPANVANFLKRFFFSKGQEFVIASLDGIAKNRFTLTQLSEILPALLGNEVLQPLIEHILTHRTQWSKFRQTPTLHEKLDVEGLAKLLIALGKVEKDAGMQCVSKIMGGFLADEMQGGILKDKVLSSILILLLDAGLKKIADKIIDIKMQYDSFYREIDLLSLCEKGCKDYARFLILTKYDMTRISLDEAKPSYRALKKKHEDIAELLRTTWLQRNTKECENLEENKNDQPPGHLSAGQGMLSKEDIYRQLQKIEKGGKSVARKSRLTALKYPVEYAFAEENESEGSPVLTSLCIDLQVAITDRNEEKAKTVLRKIVGEHGLRGATLANGAGGTDTLVEGLFTRATNLNPGRELSYNLLVFLADLADKSGEINNGFDVDQSTMLHLAIKNLHFPLFIRLLRSQVVQTSQQDALGRTPLDIAVDTLISTLDAYRDDMQNEGKRKNIEAVLKMISILHNMQALSITDTDKRIHNEFTKIGVQAKDFVWLNSIQEYHLLKQRVEKISLYKTITLEQFKKHNFQPGDMGEYPLHNEGVNLALHSLLSAKLKTPVVEGVENPEYQFYHRPTKNAPCVLNIKTNWCKTLINLGELDLIKNRRSDTKERLKEKFEEVEAYVKQNGGKVSLPMGFVCSIETGVNHWVTCRLTLEKGSSESQYKLKVETFNPTVIGGFDNLKEELDEIKGRIKKHVFSGREDVNIEEEHGKNTFPFKRQNDGTMCGWISAEDRARLIFNEEPLMYCHKKGEVGVSIVIAAQARERMFEAMRRFNPKKALGLFKNHMSERGANVNPYDMWRPEQFSSDTEEFKHVKSDAINMLRRLKDLQHIKNLYENLYRGDSEFFVYLKEKAKTLKNRCEILAKEKEEDGFSQGKKDEFKDISILLRVIGLLLEEDGSDFKLRTFKKIPLDACVLKEIVYKAYFEVLREQAIRARRESNVAGVNDAIAKLENIIKNLNEEKKDGRTFYATIHQELSRKLKHLKEKELLEKKLHVKQMVMNDKKVALRGAIEKGDIERVKQNIDFLIKADPDVLSKRVINEGGKVTYTIFGALLYYCFYNKDNAAASRVQEYAQEFICKYPELLNRVFDSKGCNPIFIATVEGSPELLKFFLEKKAIPNVIENVTPAGHQVSYRQTPLDYLMFGLKAKTNNKQGKPDSIYVGSCIKKIQLLLNSGGCFNLFSSNQLIGDLMSMAFIRDLSSIKNEIMALTQLILKIHTETMDNSKGDKQNTMPRFNAEGFVPKVVQPTKKEEQKEELSGLKAKKRSRSTEEEPQKEKTPPPPKSSTEETSNSKPKIEELPPTKRRKKDGVNVHHEKREWKEDPNEDYIGQLFSSEVDKSSWGSSENSNAIVFGRPSRRSIEKLRKKKIEKKIPVEVVQKVGEDIKPPPSVTKKSKTEIEEKDNDWWGFKAEEKEPEKKVEVQQDDTNNLRQPKESEKQQKEEEKPTDLPLPEQSKEEQAPKQDTVKEKDDKITGKKRKRVEPKETELETLGKGLDDGQPLKKKQKTKKEAEDDKGLKGGSGNEKKEPFVFNPFIDKNSLRQVEPKKDEILEEDEVDMDEIEELKEEVSPPPPVFGGNKGSSFAGVPKLPPLPDNDGVGLFETPITRKEHLPPLPSPPPQILSKSRQIGGDDVEEDDDKSVHIIKKEIVRPPPPPLPREKEAAKEEEDVVEEQPRTPQQSSGDWWGSSSTGTNSGSFENGPSLFGGSGSPSIVAKPPAPKKPIQGKKVKKDGPSLGKSGMFAGKSKKKEESEGDKKVGHKRKRHGNAVDPHLNLDPEGPKDPDLKEPSEKKRKLNKGKEENGERKGNNEFKK